MVTVHLHTVLRLQTEQGLVGRLETPWSPGMDVGKLLGNLNIIINEEHTLLVVNGLACGLDQPLQDSDDVHLIPAISGG